MGDLDTSSRFDGIESEAGERVNGSGGVAAAMSKAAASYTRTPRGGEGPPDAAVDVAVDAAVDEEEEEEDRGGNEAVEANPSDPTKLAAAPSASNDTWAPNSCLTCIVLELLLILLPLLPRLP